MDPLDLHDINNLHLYAESNPTVFFDLYGLCRASKKMGDCLEFIFGEPVDQVHVAQRPKYVRLHGRDVIATTRKNSSALKNDCGSFWADERLVLEEFFHVLRQWNTGKLTRRRYLREGMRDGYNNRFEKEAKKIARKNAQGLRDCLGCGQ